MLPKSLEAHYRHEELLLGWAVSWRRDTDLWEGQESLVYSIPPRAFIGEHATVASTWVPEGTEALFQRAGAAFHPRLMVFVGM